MALGQGRPVKEARPDSGDIAVLQYTGGTTGVAKGAMLTHRNLIANMLQARGLMGDSLEEAGETISCVGQIGKEGMKETDVEILTLMISE